MEKIAIIGLSCLFPDAKNPDEFWQNLIEQKNSITSVTVEEMGVEPTIFYEPKKGKLDKIYYLLGGHIRDFKFDPTGYNLPGEFLEKLDPIFQSSLYVAKQALQQSHYWQNQKVLSKCGIILGNLSVPTKFSNQVFAPIYEQAIEPAVRELLGDANFRLPNSEAQACWCNANTSGLPSALVAQALALSSINFSLDAACSSVLYAMKLASYYLLRQKANLMLAGGICYPDQLFTRMIMSGVQAYPENGISRPLDKLSTGLTPAEGVGMVVLKRYSEAIRDGDPIYATICGIGLSNDGRGKHLLSPNPKGQMLAYQRAYEEAKINPKDIDYLECHATGTLVGDTTELSTIDAFFGQHQASPLVGSVKSNIGHLLTAAGIASTIKIILSMSKGIIPATINISEPLSVSNQAISTERIVKDTIIWPNKSVKHAAVSAFGFGGNNAHMILERGNIENIKNFLPTTSEPLHPAKLAIVGMDAFFGSCDGLDAFERGIYEGRQYFRTLPPKRWKGIEQQQQLLTAYGFEEGEAPLGAYIEDFEIDPMHFKIPPNEAEKLNPQQLLMLKVADRALKDAGVVQGGNVAVIIAMETELAAHQLQQRWNLSWQIKEALMAESVSVTPEQISQLETIVKDSIHKGLDSSEYLSYVGNILASRISVLWNFTGPSFTLSAGENSVFKALEVAQMLLTAREVDTVIVGAVDLAGGVENVLWRNQLANINTDTNTLSYNQNTNGWMVGEGAGAVILKRLDTAKQEQNRIYSVIDAISLIQEEPANSEELKDFPLPSTAKTVTQACQQAFMAAGLKPIDINYIEVYGSGLAAEDESEIQGLMQAYQSVGGDLRCALGSVKANIGHTYAASGMASLIKTALCLYYRYIPATPKWTGPKKLEVWQGSPFYVATESKPWFLEQGASTRVAAINGLGLDRTHAHLILSEETTHIERKSKYLELMPFFLFPLAADEKSTLLEQLNALEKTITDCSCLSNAASLTFATFQKHSHATYTLAILGHNKDELIQEIRRAIQGVAYAFERGKDWKTPMGSYFTAKPLGKRGSIAFVYPGLFNSYIGLGRQLLRLFPKIYEPVNTYVAELGQVYREKLIYPRSLSLLSNRQIEKLEQELLNDTQAMVGSGIGFAVGLAAIMRDYFQIQPQSTFGYSLGELSMMCAESIWSNYDQSLNLLSSSSVFKTQLSGPKNAVRKYWGVPLGQEHENADIWSNYVLMTPASQVMEYLERDEQQAKRVFLTHINTPTEVVIAGDPQECQKAIATLNCDSFRVPFNHVLHCEPVRSEYHELVKLNTLPIQNLSEVVFYSAADYKPISLNSNTIGHTLAQCLCQQLDFPRLINRVYEDGTRIFIEVGAGSTCSRWISESLKQKEHLAVPLNKRGVDDHHAIVRALAMLVSHRITLDLSPLYCSPEKTLIPAQSMIKKITLGGCRIRDKILSDESKKIIHDISISKNKFSEQSFQKYLKIQNFQELNKISYSQSERNMLGKTDSYQSFSNESLKILENSQTSQEKANLEDLEQILSQKLEKLNATRNLKLSDSRKAQLNKLSADIAKMTKSHTNFLQFRHESLKRISTIIQLQITCSQHFLNQK
jgi:PfaB family protein